MKKNLLEKLRIVQVSTNGKLGRGFSKAYRFNVYNPLSYIVIIVGVVLGTLISMIKGGKTFLSDHMRINPFKWD